MSNGGSHEEEAEPRGRRSGLIIGLGATPAFATLTTCPTTKSCTWGDSQYQTSGLLNARIEFAAYLTSLGAAYPGTTRSGNNSASSTDNRGTTQVRYYDNLKCNGSYNTRSGGGQDSDFSNGDPVWDGTGTTVNDKYESGAFNIASYITSCRA